MTSDHAPGPRRHPRPPPTRRRRMDATHRHHPLRRRRPRTHTHRHQGEPVTTRIHDRSCLPTYVDLTATGNTVTVRASNGLMAGTAKVDRAEFLAAVANELDVIVIPRSDLPEVTSTYAGGLRAIHGPTGSEATIRVGDSAANIRGLALCYLAIAEHRENAVDEAQVNALARLVAAETNGTHIAATALARRLIQA